MDDASKDASEQQTRGGAITCCRSPRAAWLNENVCADPIHVHRDDAIIMSTGYSYVLPQLRAA